MSQWYLSYDGKQTGPMNQSQAAVQAQANPDGYAWREGFADWVPIAKIAELSSTPLAMAGIPAPPPMSGSRSRVASTNCRRTRNSASRPSASPSAGGDGASCSACSRTGASRTSTRPA